MYEWERVVCLFVREIVPLFRGIALLFRIIKLLFRILELLLREIKCRQAECAKHPK